VLTLGLLGGAGCLVVLIVRAHLFVWDGGGGPFCGDVEGLLNSLDIGSIHGYILLAHFRTFRNR